MPNPLQAQQSLVSSYTAYAASSGASVTYQGRSLKLESGARPDVIDIFTSEPPPPSKRTLSTFMRLPRLTSEEFARGMQIKAAEKIPHGRHKRSASDEFPDYGHHDGAVLTDSSSEQRRTAKKEHIAENLHELARKAERKAREIEISLCKKDDNLCSPNDRADKWRRSGYYKKGGLRLG